MFISILCFVIQHNMFGYFFFYQNHMVTWRARLHAQGSGQGAYNLRDNDKHKRGLRQQRPDQDVERIIQK